MQCNRMVLRAARARTGLSEASAAGQPAADHTPLLPLREVVEFFRQVDLGVATPPRFRRRLKQHAKALGIAILPALLRALASGSASSTYWASQIAWDLDLVHRPRVISRLRDLLKQPRVSAGNRASIIALLEDFGITVSESLALADTEQLIEQSVRDMLDEIDSEEMLKQALTLIFSQIDRRTLRDFLEQVLQYGGERAWLLLDAVLLDVRTPRAVALWLTRMQRPAAQRPRAAAPPSDSQPSLRTEEATALLREELGAAALAALQAGHPAQALSTLHELLDAGPLSPPLGLALGQILLSMGRPEDALLAYRQVSEKTCEADRLWGMAVAAALSDHPEASQQATLSYLAVADEGPAAMDRHALAQVLWKSLSDRTCLAPARAALLAQCAVPSLRAETPRKRRPSPSAQALARQTLALLRAQECSGARLCFAVACYDLSLPESQPSPALASEP